MTLTELGLYPFQQGALSNTADAFFDQGLTRQLGVLPTGTGKTVVASGLAHQPRLRDWMETFAPSHRKVLMVAHTEELVTQAKKKFEKYHPTLRVEIERADEYASPAADVVIASVPTLAARKGRRLMKFDKDQFRIIVVDEAHHSIARTYQSVLQYFDFLPTDTFMPKPGPMNANQALAFQRDRLAKWDALAKPARLLLGITATPIRTDKVGLEAVYQTIAFEEPILKMIRGGYLSPPRAFRVTSKTSIDHVKSKAGDFDQAALAQAVDNEERNRLIVKGWKELAEGRQTFAFCASVKHAEDLARCFREHGVPAAMISGETDDRPAVLRAFEKRHLTVLTNFNVLTEGVDVTSVSCILHARPTKSPLLYTQMTGRGLRLSEGKSDCIIIDVVDMTKQHSLQTAPTLLGLPCDFDAKGQNLSDVMEKIEKAKEAQPLLDVTGVRSLEDLHIRSEEVALFAPMHDVEAEKHGTLNWIKMPDGSYHIGMKGRVAREVFTITPDQHGTFAVTMQELGGTTSLGTVTTLAEAFTRTERYVGNRNPNEVRHLDRHADWRNEAIGDKQLRYLGEILKVQGFQLDKLTRGQASDLIDMRLSEAR